jgi:uncharacterized DUF497 family protein
MSDPSAHKPPAVLRPGLEYLSRIFSHLRPAGSAKRTLYTLRVFSDRGINKCTLAGPATVPFDVTSAWPASSRQVARTMLTKSSAEMRASYAADASVITIILIVQAGREAHCAIISMRAASSTRGAGVLPRRSESCAGSAQASGY